MNIITLLLIIMSSNNIYKKKIISLLYEDIIQYIMEHNMRNTYENFTFSLTTRKYVEYSPPNPLISFSFAYTPKFCNSPTPFSPPKVSSKLSEVRASSEARFTHHNRIVRSSFRSELHAHTRIPSLVWARRRQESLEYFAL